MRKFDLLREDTWQNMSYGAGILLSSFNPTTGTVSAANILGATTGGLSFEVSKEYKDEGEDVDNAPKNLKEFKTLDSQTVTVSGTFLSLTDATLEKLIGECDSIVTHESTTPPYEKDITMTTPRSTVELSDFHDIWFLLNFTDNNDETEGNFMAVHLKDCLNTGGFRITSTDNGKAQFPFTFTAHSSLSNLGEVPYEVYVSRDHEGESDIRGEESDIRGEEE